MTTDPGDLVFDPTCGSGTTAFCAERLGPPLDHVRHIARRRQRRAQRLLSAGTLSITRREGQGLRQLRLQDASTAITLKSLAYDLEPERVELVDQPEWIRAPSASAAPSR